MPILPADPLIVLLTMTVLLVATWMYWRVIRRRGRTRRMDRESDEAQLRGLVRVTLVGR
jgi:membrane protein implicated in regulation of membrane protease activity